MMSGPTAEQRARDGRLAWMIIGLCALLTTTLIVLVSRFAYGQATRWAAESVKRDLARIDEEQRRGVEAEAPWARVDGRIPVDVADTPAPPNTTRPVGDVASWIRPDDYPPYARRNGDEGRVRVTVSVDAAGAPLGCAVAQTSGHWSLDNATCAVMLNKGRFEPARPGFKGRRHWTSPPVRWRLPGEA